MAKRLEGRRDPGIGLRLYLRSPQRQNPIGHLASC